MTTPFKPVVGQFAMTRDGRRAFVYNFHDNFEYFEYVFLNDDGLYCCHENGKYLYDEDQIPDYNGEHDLMAPWVDQKDKVLEEMAEVLELSKQIESTNWHLIPNDKTKAEKGLRRKVKKALTSYKILKGRDE